MGWDGNYALYMASWTLKLLTTWLVTLALSDYLQLKISAAFWIDGQGNIQLLD